MSRDQLFRPEAIVASQAASFGQIVLIRPLSFFVMTAGALVVAVLLLAFFALGTYTKRSTAQGQIVPSSGLAKVYPLQAGIVLKKYVAEGQSVKKGDVLFVLSSDRQSGMQKNIQESISASVAERRKSFEDELAKTRTVQQDERNALVRKIASLNAEFIQLGEQIESQKSRVKLSEDSVARYDGLLAQGYISKEQLQQRQEDLIDQRLRMQSLERERISVGQDLADQKSALISLGLRQQNQLAQLQRSISSTDQDLTESEGKRQLFVTAPETGIATAIVVEVGQMADGNRPLVSIVPTGADLQAHLYVPSKAIGFIKAGAPVLLRYQAYPYQKFGHAKGTVISVSRTALSASELSATSNIASGNTGEPVYLVVVALASQTVVAYGRKEHLQAGMLLDADILQEKRHLYEWVLEPLYSLTGKLF
jgi:membrane fusion protein